MSGFPQYYPLVETVSGAKHSQKSNPYHSAMPMLTFYINRAGKQLPKKDHDRLESARDALRDLYGKRRKAA